MSSLLDFWLRWLRFPEQLVTRLGGALIALTLGVPASGLIFAALNKTPSLERFTYSALPIPVLAVLWAIAREIYWRAGRGRRVGLAFKGYRATSEDFAYAREQLHLLAHNSRTETPIQLRLVPHSMVATATSAVSFLRSRHFDLLAHVTVSPSTRDDRHQHFSCELSADFKTEIARQLRQGTQQHIDWLSRHPPPFASLDELVKSRMSVLFDSLLLALAANDLADQRFTSAAHFAEALNARLDGRCPSSQHPRRGVQWVGKTALLHDALTGLSGRGTTPGAFESLLSRAAKACSLYGEQFPECYTVHARACFLNGDLELAMASTKALAAVAKSPIDRAAAALNQACLHLIQANWHESARFYRLLFQGDDWTKLNWDDLIDFADMAWEMGHHPATFMRALYRKVRFGASVSPEILEPALRWLADDSSRAELQKLYFHACPQLSVQQVRTAERPQNVLQKTSRPFKRRRK